MTKFLCLVKSAGVQNEELGITSLQNDRIDTPFSPGKLILDVQVRVVVGQLESNLPTFVGDHLNVFLHGVELLEQIQRFDELLSMFRHPDLQILAQMRRR